MLDGALFKMVKHLIADGPVWKGNLVSLPQVAYIEVADAPGKDFTLAPASSSKAAIVSSIGKWPRQCSR